MPRNYGAAIIMVFTTADVWYHVDLLDDWRQHKIVWSVPTENLFKFIEFHSVSVNRHCCHISHLLVPNVTTLTLNTTRPRQNGRRFADGTFKSIFLNENVIISIKISMKLVPKGPINNNPALVQIMAWRRSGDKPLSEPMMVSLLTHICVTWPQWVKGYHWCVHLALSEPRGAPPSQTVACWTACHQVVRMSPPWWTPQSGGICYMYLH